MAEFYVGPDRATKVEREKGHTVTIDNTQNTVDLYYDSDYNRINAAAPGQIPNGSKIAAGTSLQIPDWSLPLYFRAISGIRVISQP